MDPISEISNLPVIAPRPPVSRDDLPTERPWEVARVEARDRRAGPRVEVELDCEERLGEQRYFRLTWDLSTFGLSTRYGYSHPMGTRLDLALYLPDAAEPVQVRAEVVGACPESKGARLAFRNPSADAVRRINRYLRTQAAA